MTNPVATLLGTWLADLHGSTRHREVLHLGVNIITSKVGWETAINAPAAFAQDVIGREAGDRGGVALFSEYFSDGKFLRMADGKVQVVSNRERPKKKLRGWNSGDSSVVGMIERATTSQARRVVNRWHEKLGGLRWHEKLGGLQPRQALRTERGLMVNITRDPSQPRYVHFSRNDKGQPVMQLFTSKAGRFEQSFKATLPSPDGKPGSVFYRDGNSVKLVPEKGKARTLPLHRSLEEAPNGTVNAHLVVNVVEALNGLLGADTPGLREGETKTFGKIRALRDLVTELTTEPRIAMPVPKKQSKQSKRRPNRKQRRKPTTAFQLKDPAKWKQIKSGATNNAPETVEFAERVAGLVEKKLAETKGSLSLVLRDPNGKGGTVAAELIHKALFKDGVPLVNSHGYSEAMDILEKVWVHGPEARKHFRY